MGMEQKGRRFLLTLAICFLAVFAIAIIFVNNWLKQALKEEVIIEKSVSIPAPAKIKYKQAPILPEASTAAPLGAERKSAISQEPRGTEKKAIDEAPVASGVLLN